MLPRHFHSRPGTWERSPGPPKGALQPLSWCTEEACSPLTLSSTLHQRLHARRG